MTRDEVMEALRGNGVSDAAQAEVIRFRYLGLYRHGEAPSRP
jgi:hypothetical protein